jgi:prepilin-type N-terminal cleavage/methylation domain-containing protein/prepilin-type processing-associated H-X9-DG protein
MEVVVVRNAGRCGFTLIELLVVIAIVIMLAAIIFPAICGVQEQARKTKCLANLNQLSRAMILYATDNGGKPPNPTAGLPELNWYGGTYGNFIWVQRGSIWKYVTNADVYMCAKDWREPAWDAYYVALQYQRPDVAEWAKKDFPLSYAMNANLRNVVIDTIRRQRTVMLLIHEGRRTINDGAYAVDRPFDRASAAHNGGTNVAYLDTHVVWRTKEELDGEKDRGYWIPTK